MKNLNNIGKPVPEPADPPLIKPVTDVLEEIDAILGAPVGDLDTSDQTVVGAINELVDAVEANATNISLLDDSAAATVANGLEKTPSTWTVPNTMAAYIVIAWANFTSPIISIVTSWASGNAHAMPIISSANMSIALSGRTLTITGLGSNWYSYTILKIG